METVFYQSHLFCLKLTVTLSNLHVQKTIIKKTPNKHKHVAKVSEQTRWQSKGMAFTPRGVSGRTVTSQKGTRSKSIIDYVYHTRLNWSGMHKIRSWRPLSFVSFSLACGKWARRVVLTYPSQHPWALSREIVIVSGSLWIFFVFFVLCLPANGSGNGIAT